jgi:replication factor A1
MDNELKPRELTRDLIHSIHKEQNKDKKSYGYLQVIQLEEGHKFMTLSDGFSYQKVALFSSIRDKVDTMGIKQYDVLYVCLLLHKGFMDVMTSFEQVYTGLTKAIGHPIPYEDYVNRMTANPDGSADIPRQFWEEKKPAAANKSQPTEPISSGPQLLKTVGIVSDDDVHSIASLTSGATEFVLRAKVINKGQKREYNQGKNKSNLFDMIIADSTDSIKCTFFSTACDKFYDVIEQGKVYLFMNGEVRKGGKFNTCKNPNEIYFSPKSIIEECKGATLEISTKYDYKKVGEMQTLPLNTTVDLLGVISGIEDKVTINLKSGGSKPKQTFKVRDDSNFEIEVSLWGDFPETEGLREGDIVLFHNMMISEFSHSRVLNSKAGQTKLLVPPPSSPQLTHLQNWKNTQQDTVKSLKQEKKSKDAVIITIEQLKKETQFLDKENMNKQTYSITAYVTSLQGTFTYQKCPVADCFKKAAPEDNGNGRTGCHCQVHGFVQQPPIPKYIGNIRVTDHTDSAYLNFTSDPVGKILFGCDAQEMHRIQSSGEVQNTSETELLKGRLNHKYTFKVMPKFETYNNKENIKYIISACYDQLGTRLYYENKFLLSTIQRLQDALV